MYWHQFWKRTPKESKIRNKKKHNPTTERFYAVTLTKCMPRTQQIACPGKRKKKEAL